MLFFFIPMDNEVRERFWGFFLLAKWFLQTENSKTVSDKTQLEILPCALAVAQSQSVKLNRIELLFRTVT